MIHGHKPNGYLLTFTPDLKRIEQETRQCVHCQKMWTHVPGSGTVRGWCINCGGFTCMEPLCLLEQKRVTDEYLQLTGKVRSCMPFEERNSRIRDKVEKLFPLDPELTVTPAGLIIPK
jgi:hypothetical protein